MTTTGAAELIAGGNQHNWRGVYFLVDSYKHRIVKRKDIWCFYCPKRGPDSVIYGITFDDILVLLQHPCPHWTEVGGLVSCQE